MIQLKCAELLFLIRVCFAASNFSVNNKPFLVDRLDVDDDFIRNVGSNFDQSLDDRFMFTTMRC